MTPEEAIQEAEKQIQLEKEAIIKKRLKEKNMSYILKDIGKKRFKKLMIVTDEFAEYVYVDDKSLDGLLLVTFIKPPVQIKDGNLEAPLQYI